MLVSSRKKEGAAVIVKRTKVPLSKRTDDKTRGAVTARRIQNIPSLRRVHKMNVLGVRQQLAEGRYDLDERLDAVVESLLVAVTP
ncbi:MAG: hypothetical protein ACYSW7_02220 [Planctomycetota bacterium]